MKHHSACGLSPQVHKHKGNTPHNVTTNETITNIKQFIENYADIHAMPLPGRLPSHRDYQVMLLPSDTTKAFVYRKFVSSCEVSGITPVSRRTFENYWHSLCPHITVIKPASDLCFTCQQNTNLLMRSVNLPESIKSECFQNAQLHLQRARVQRQDYNDQCKKAYDDLAVCSKLGKPPTYMHYSFDFAQQLQ